MVETCISISHIDGTISHVNAENSVCSASFLSSVALAHVVNFILPSVSRLTTSTRHWKNSTSFAPFGSYKRSQEISKGSDEPAIWEQAYFPTAIGSVLLHSIAL